MSKTLCHMSGGFDSVASTLKVAYQLLPFSTVFFDLGQHYLEEERRAVAYVTEFLREKFPDTYLGHSEVAVPMSFNTSDPSVPAEYIPIRNLVLGAVSMNKALAEGFDKIAVGNKTTEVRADDPYSFADCSVEFYKRMGNLGTYASQGKIIEFTMPLVVDGTAMTKEQVIELCIASGMTVTNIWSCYNKGDKYCGTCYHCQEIAKTKFSNLFF